MQYAKQCNKMNSRIHNSVIVQYYVSPSSYIIHCEAEEMYYFYKKLRYAAVLLIFDIFICVYGSNHSGFIYYPQVFLNARCHPSDIYLFFHEIINIANDCVWYPKMAKIPK